MLTKSTVMTAVDKWGMQSGIIKIIPPSEWVAAQPRLDEAIKTIRVKEPIIQDIAGQNGMYRQTNIVQQRSYNLPEWRELCNKSHHQPPAKRGERRPNQAQAKPVRSTTKSKGRSSATGSKRKSARTSKAKAVNNAVEEEEEAEGTPDRLPTPVSPSMKEEDDNESVAFEQDEPEAPVVRRMGGRQAMAIQPKEISISARRKNNKRETAVIDEAVFKDFQYELDGEPFTQERCDELERNYWKTLTYASPLYGADMPGSLFDDRTTSWNLGKLPNLLDVLGTKIPGVNTAYLYLGMWKATFAWHLEDVDLYSINYLHFGAPKQWYSISQRDARKFEQAMASIWPTDAKACDQFLRHKTFLISPSTLLAQHGIRVNKIVHHPGEFVVTYPYGYHSGYNLGYNCAEAVNFALDSWIEYARCAKRCDCSDAQDSVWINIRDIERKLRGEDTDIEETDEEDEEDEEDDENEVDDSGLPSPPQSNGETKTKAPQKKRKRPVNDKGEKVSGKKIRIKGSPEGPCILCPHDIPSEPLLLTDDGKKVHRICAQYIPETRIDPGEKPGDPEVVMDYEHIPKARLELKCNYCHSKKGACFQCSQKKCARAYHATCAAAAGVFVEEGEVPHFGENGIEYKKWDFGFSCRFHRVKRDKKLDGDALGDDKRIMKAASELKVGTVCQLQFYRGDIFAGVVVENRMSEQMLLVDIIPRLKRCVELHFTLIFQANNCFSEHVQMEVEYKWLLLPDPSDYHLPKASPTALAMPKEFKEREKLNTSKRQADDLPRAEDLFVPGFKWSEFNRAVISRNPNQAKIELTKGDQIWYYLGKTSTEAKAQFTEDLARPRHNPKGHFLDTIPKPVPTIPRQSYAASYPSIHGQNNLNVARTVARPQQAILPPSANKAEKPYQYKPRNPAGETYRVDPQALQSQQSFLQRSAQTPTSKATPNSTPYSFGTDPRYQPSARPAIPYPSYPQSTGQAQPSMGPLAVPALYRAPRPVPVPAKPAGPPFPSSGSRSRLSPFAKYAYLQKEHNRSPLEYKSPYRPGGGFMNGYQGSLQSLEARMRAQIWGSNAARNSTPASILPPQSSSSHPGPQNTIDTSAPPSQTAISATAPTSSSASTPNLPASSLSSASGNGMLIPPSGTPTQASWQKKDNSNLHPAIRPEYTMFHNQYQPVQRQSPPQYQGSVMQPPAMYDRQAGQMQPQYQIHQPQQIVQPRNSSPQAYTSMNDSPVNNTYSPHTMHLTAVQQDRQSSPPTSQQFVAAYSHQAPQSTSQQPMMPAPHNQHMSAQNTRAAMHVPPAAHQQYPPNATNIPQPVAQVPAPPQVAAQENRALYPHQQYFQNTKVEAQLMQSLHPHAQPRDFPDVPADSTSIIERVMMNLKKAPGLPTTN